MASATDVPCEVSTSTWRSLATICSGVCLLLAISVLLPGSKAIPQGGPLCGGGPTGWHRSCPLSAHIAHALAPIRRDRGHVAHQVIDRPGPGTVVVAAEGQRAGVE